VETKMKKLFALLFSWVAVSGYCGQVTKISGTGKFREVRIAHYGEVYYHWVINDEVCLLREVGSQEKVCGNVVRYDKVETVLKFPKERVVFAEGETIKIMYQKRKVAAAAPAQELAAAVREEARPKMNVSVGMGTGFSYLFFDAHFKYAVSNKVTLGVMPVFINDSGVNTSVKAFGGFLTGDYYFREHYSGFRVESGIGFYSISATAGALEETSSPFALYSTFGWRGKINQSGLTVGGAGGFQLVGNSSSTLLVDFKGILPLVQIEVGYTF